MSGEAVGVVGEVGREAQGTYSGRESGDGSDGAAGRAIPELGMRWRTGGQR